MDNRGTAPFLIVDLRSWQVVLIKMAMLDAYAVIHDTVRVATTTRCIKLNRRLKGLFL
ncbi:hypothetical protein [Thermoflavimicrobium daqui]|uniref:hypothetical protein n=1 Tax=Thermoflavimicrobium daqui TaxID=2137476 RepID=UPI00143CCD02|nr:hypothetical protein [Thermoflavimicrobium daqui]